jgi:DNA-3-methyladenine glycosylase II
MTKALNRLRRSDPALAAVIQKVGPCRIDYLEPQFATLARSIVYQQLNGKAAASIFARFQSGCGGAVTPDAILRLRPAKMRTLGLSPQKTEYLRDLARRARSGEIDFAVLAALDDDQVIARLTAVKGVGVWTVHMFLMFALRRPDVLPVGDFGVRSAMKRLYNLADLPKPVEMQRLAEPWRPWRSVASWYLWRSLEAPAAITQEQPV